MSATSFITEWNMPAASFTLPLRSGYTYNMVVDWGDGSPTSTITDYADTDKTHVYATAGTYQISIDGTCSAWYINSISAIKGLITKVIQWGDVGFTGLGLVSAFRGVTTNIELPTGPLTGATGCTSIQSMFSASKLLAIPDGFLDQMPNLTSAISFCDSNTVLQYIPIYLFRNNPLCTNFSYAFRECRSAVLNKWIFFADGEENTRFATVGGFINLSYVFQRSYYYAASPGQAPELWNCNFGTSSVSKNYCYSNNGNNLDSLTNYCSIPIEWGANKTNCPILESIGAAWHSATQEKISITTTEAPAETDTFNCYVSTSETGLVSPENLVAITQVSDTIYEAIATIESDATEYFVYVEYSNGITPEYLEYTDTHYIVGNFPTTTITIANTDNYLVFNSPLSQHSYNHGFLHLNGYIYGSARNDWHSSGGGYWGTSVFKIKANDYSDVTQKTIYRNQTNPDVNDVIASIDQIVYCQGFIWGQGYNYGNSFLLRIDPATLDHILWITAEIANRNQPIGTDGTYLYLTGDTSIKKYDTSLLLGTAASYGFDETAPIALPIDVVLATCNISQLHPTQTTYTHSFITDSNYIYLANTYCPTMINGWDNTLLQYSTNYQKIAISTMQTVQTIGIPACTDDMVQNSDYIFLCPEIRNTTDVFDGTNWGLLAIKKSDLTIKYLKALAPEFNTENESDRAGYGVFYFQDKISVQLINSKKTVVIKLDQIDLWGADFPIGGATEAIYSFQIEGVPISEPCNELIMDDNGYIHTNTWGVYTTVFKFTFDQVFPQNFNVLTLSNTNATALLELINENFGCSIRCVQDAPGETDGTTGTATDADGNTYDTIVINEKRWFVQNLKTTKFRNGESIPEITDGTSWANATGAAQCEYE